MNPTNEQELREQVLTEFKQVHKLAPADYTENCTNVVMSIIKAHTNAEIAKVLDTIESAVLGEVTDEEERYEVYTAIQAERAKLKEVK